MVYQHFLFIHMDEEGDIVMAQANPHHVKSVTERCVGDDSEALCNTC